MQGFGLLHKPESVTEFLAAHAARFNADLK
jgi:hypothetical protein